MLDDCIARDPSVPHRQDGSERSSQTLILAACSGVRMWRRCARLPAYGDRTVSDVSSDNPVPSLGGAMPANENQPKREPSLYTKLASEGAYGPGIGSALITMVEPHPGQELAYNRWYEDDHYISGAMAMPWMFAGRRWVATRPLQLLRYPADSAVAKPVTAGAYITVY